MYTLPKSNYLKRSLLVNLGRPVHIPAANFITHEQRIKKELKALGMSRFGLWRLESRYLPNIIHLGEQLKGVLYGYNEEGSVMLAATDRRLIFLDKKPLFINEDEVTYDVVSGVKYSNLGIGSTVTLHTRVKDYTIHTLNKRSAGRFVKYIESRCLEHKPKEVRHDYFAKKWAI